MKKGKELGFGSKIQSSIFHVVVITGASVG